MLPLIIAILITGSDQLTKVWVHGSFAYGESRPVIPGFFDLTYVRNTGAAFGAFAGQTQLLGVFSIAMLALLIVYRDRIIGTARVHRIILGLLVGGIIGNVMDRIRLGFVVDFLDFHIAGHHWPAFNIADSAICTAVGLYILHSFRTSKPATDNKPDAKSA